MGSTGLRFYGHCVVMFLLQMITPSAEQFTVTGSEGPVLTPLGGTLELSCQLSPPQNAQHMEIRWFRNHYTQPVHLYRGGKDLHGETISKYVERTELLKDAIGEGKVTLRILSVTVDDDGPYHCVFKDGDFYEEHITEVKVTAVNLRVQIHLHPPNTKGLIVECHSEGWFPRPLIEWRDGRGEVIPAASKSHSQDGDKLFIMNTTLLVKDSSSQKVICCFQNPLTGQEQRTSIVLSDAFFSWNRNWKTILGIILLVMVFSIMVSSFQLYYRRKHIQANLENFSKLNTVFTDLSLQFVKNPKTLSRVTVKFSMVQGDKVCICSQLCCTQETSIKEYILKCSWYTCTAPWVINILIMMFSVLIVIGVMVWMHRKERIPVSDAHFELDTLWLEDISVILGALMISATMLISYVYFRLRGKWDEKCVNS